MLVAVFGAVAYTEVACGQANVIQDITKSWGDRQAAVSAARIKFTSTEILSAEFMAAQARYAVSKASTAKNMLVSEASKAVELRGECVLHLDGIKRRFEYDGQAWSTKIGQVAPRKYVSTYDGSQYAYTSLINTITDHPEVTINNAQAAKELQHVKLRPLWFSIRGKHAIEEGFPLLAFSAIGRPVEHQGRTCQEIIRTTQQGEVETLLIAPGFNHQVVSRTIATRGVVVTAMDIQYESHSVLGWTPKAWNYTSRNQKGVIQVSGNCLVTEFHVNDFSHQASYQPVLPPLARVVDIASGKEIQYGINPDGSKGQPIDADNKAVKYEDLFVDNNRTSRSIITLTVFGALALIFLFVLYKRGRAKPK